VTVVSKLSNTFASQLKGQVGRIRSYGVVAAKAADAERAAKVEAITPVDFLRCISFSGYMEEI
jgi:hypothetical protein